MTDNVFEDLGKVLRSGGAPQDYGQPDLAANLLQYLCKTRSKTGISGIEARNLMERLFPSDVCDEAITKLHKSKKIDELGFPSKDRRLTWDNVLLCLRSMSPWALTNKDLSNIFMCNPQRCANLTLLMYEAGEIRRLEPDSANAYKHFYYLPAKD